MGDIDRIIFDSDDFVTRFSLSFSEDDDNFTEYIRDTGLTVSYWDEL